MKVDSPTSSLNASSKVTKRLKCTKSGKSAFKKRKRALSYAGAMGKQFNRKYHAYKCSLCNHWHLTTKEQY